MAGRTETVMVTVAASEQRRIGWQRKIPQRVGRRRAARHALTRATVNVKAIFGLKLKRLREQRHLTLAELSQRTGVSTSYLAEIEAGKKFPKPDRIFQIAKGLDSSYDDLISTKLGEDLEALEGLLNTPGVRDFPFETFGLPIADVVKLLTRSPNEVRALLRTLSDVAQQYNIGVEHLLRAALRSYQELIGNYDETIEREAAEFAAELGALPRGGWNLSALREWVAGHGVQEIDEELLGARPTLRTFRAVRVQGTRPRLLVNPRLTDFQKAFVMAREAGYQRLGLDARSLATPPNREDSFEQVLNDFQASYFAGAVLLPRAALSDDLRAFFKLPTWQAEALLHLLDTYRVTPEALMYRISQLVSSQFGFRAHFMKFADVGGDLRLVKALHLAGPRIPSGLPAMEHYCRRWLATRLLVDLRDRQRRHPRRPTTPLVGVQYSKFLGDESPGFLDIGLALPQPLDPAVNISLTISLEADDKLVKTVRFVRDRTIPQVLVHGTCERCPLAPDSCSDRVAEPSIHNRELARHEQEEELAALARQA
jgi:transcriptional regulator with XRE-family HTH domain